MVEVLAGFIDDVTTRLKNLETAGAKLEETDAKLTADIERVEGKIGNALPVKMYHNIMSVFDEAPPFGFQ